MGIITSRLDIDLYKFKMLYFLWKMDLGDRHCTYKFFNRSNIDLMEYTNTLEINKEIWAFEKLVYTAEEIDYLKKLFEPAFVNFLINIEKAEVRLTPMHTGFDLTISGKYSEIILYETIVLSIINELYCQRVDNVLIPNVNSHQLYGNLTSTMNKIKGTDVKFTEFGTRRRYSAAWQEGVVYALKENLLENMIGTSNVHLAMKYDIPAVGTIAHEMFSFFAASVPFMPLVSQPILVKEWSKIFFETFYLTDTFGTSWFLDNCCDPVPYGLRHDSGDPDKWMEALAKKFPDENNRPCIMFSDGLDADTILKLQEKYTSWNPGFGWGTNLTNNCLIKPLSIVVKLWEVEDQPCVKLSDNPEKAIGDKAAVEKYKSMFSYNKNITKSEKVVY